MASVLERLDGYFDTLIHYPRLEIYAVFGVLVMIIIVVLACIFLRDRWLNGEPAREAQTGER